MKKATVITIENLPKQKMSAIFESVNYDLDKVTKQGIKIDMDTFIRTDYYGVCAVCLGGAAVCGFFPILNDEVLYDLRREVWGDDREYKINGYKLTDGQLDNLRSMSYMFNDFRQGDIYGVASNFEAFSESEIAYETKSIISEIWEKAGYESGDKNSIEFSSDIEEIKKAINEFVKLLKKYNL